MQPNGLAEKKSGRNAAEAIGCISIRSEMAETAPAEFFSGSKRFRDDRLNSAAERNQKTRRGRILFAPAEFPGRRLNFSSPAEPPRANSASPILPELSRRLFSEPTDRYSGASH
jgi:hypothetical protein